MHSNFFDRFADGFLFGLFVNSRPMLCCQDFYMPSSPCIPSVDKSLLNSVFELSIQNNQQKINYNDSYLSFPSEPRTAFPELPSPLFSASPSINTPYLDGGLYSFFPPSYQIDYSLLNPLMNMQVPTFGLLNTKKQIESMQMPAQEQRTNKTAVSTENQNKPIKPKESKLPKTVVQERKPQYNSSNREFAQLYQELGISDKRFQKIFEECILKNEGKEPGKDTPVIWDVKAYNKNGVLQDTYNEYRTKYKHLETRDISQMTLKEMCELYYKMFYVDGGAINVEDDRLALYVFDSAVNMGQNSGKILLTRSGNSASRFEAERRKEYDMRIAKNPNLGKYRDGWMDRIKKTKAYADKNFA